MPQVSLTPVQSILVAAIMFVLHQTSSWYKSPVLDCLFSSIPALLSIAVSDAITGFSLSPYFLFFLAPNRHFLQQGQQHSK